MKVKITYLPTQNEVNELDLGAVTTLKGECIVGRSPDCDLPLESPDISRVHGKFSFQNGNYYFYDLGSRNGSIINNNLAEKDHPYILKHGDSIQIGDYVLKLEEIKPEQLAETVVRFIDPSIFSSKVSPDVSVADVTEQPSPVVSQDAEEVINPTQEEEVVSEVVSPVYSEVQEVIDIPETPGIEAAGTVIQTQNIFAVPPETVDNVETAETEEEADLTPAIEATGTVIQTQNIFAAPRETVDNVETAETEEEADLTLAIEDERTVVQTRPFSTEELAPEASVSTAEVEADITPDITDVDEISTSEESVTEAPVSIAEVEADITSEITDADEVSTSEESVTEAPVSIAEVEADITSEITDADEVSTSEEPVTEAPVSIAEVEADSILEITPEITATDESSTSEKVAEVEEVQAVNQVEANTESEASQMTIPKNIVLIAHETMKLELADLVAKYQEFFAQSVTVSWPSLSEVLEEQAGITVSEEIPPATSGGYQKINSLLNSGDVLAMIFLRDFFTPQPGPINANEETLLKVCNINQVLMATNVKTAEAIIHYLQHIKG